MAEESSTHSTSVLVINKGSIQVDAGGAIALKVRVSCALACDLRGEIVKIVAHDNVVVAQAPLVSFDDVTNETDRFVFRAPAEPGQYTWTAVLSAQGQDGLEHEASSAPFSVAVRPHATSIAIWDVPSPIAFNQKFSIKVGVQCSSECKLADHKIEIYDHQGAWAAMGALGDTPWSETGGLYWAEIELQAPGAAGLYTWTVRSPKRDLELVHEASAYTFSFATASPPEHVVAVEAIDQDTKTPIRDVCVLMHPYRTFTDEKGTAKLRVPKGKYELQVLKSYYRDWETTIEVASDVAVEAELVYDSTKMDSA